MDLNGNVYGIDTSGNLYSAPWVTSNPVWTHKAAQYTFPAGSTVTPKGLTASIEGSLLVSITVVTASPVTTTDYLFGLSMDGTTYYTNSGPSSTVSGTAAQYTGLSSIDLLYFNVVLNTDHNVYSMDVMRLMHLLLPYAAKYLGSLL